MTEPNKEAEEERPHRGKGGELSNERGRRRTEQGIGRGGDRWGRIKPNRGEGEGKWRVWREQNRTERGREKVGKERGRRIGLKGGERKWGRREGGG